MILADIFTYNKTKYFIWILVFIGINTLLHPLTAGYVPPHPDGSPDFVSAFATNFITWAISYSFVGLIIGGGIAVFIRKKGEPLQVRTAKTVISTIFWMQLTFALFHLYFFASDLISYLFR